MTDAATPELTPAPKSRRRLFIILAIIAVVVIALIAGSYLYASSAAGSKASDYDDDYAAWKAKEKPILLAATASVPHGTYVRKNASTPKALATQKEGCDAVADSRKKLADAADGLPKMATGGFLSKVSSDYSEAGDKSARREKTVRAYVKAATSALAQVERDCRWNIGYNASGVAPDKLWDSSDKYALEPGDTEPGGIFCGKGREGCVSSIAKKKNTYADLRLKAIKQYTARNLKYFSADTCGRTSYGAACKVFRQAYVGQNRLQAKNYRYVRTMKSSVNNPKLNKNNNTYDKLVKSNGPKIRKAVLALDPALRKDKDVRNYPWWTDHFLARMGAMVLADLKDERAAIAKL
ncbi:hypothetical protein [Aeromicrobium sp. 9AM]|uniref:hypothetical protein n=1 Tax=Aeromicrobium sp. 9AM TaxID=2653126 RepID=UPI0012F050C4|nr:hypothetical protein [Aeromicrobium sp. 9AM]VXC23985.1 conserved hypothetical protein [Aeromicrobium sp. 9AM]